MSNRIFVRISKVIGSLIYRICYAVSIFIINTLYMTINRNIFIIICRKMFLPGFLGAGSGFAGAQPRLPKITQYIVIFPA